MEVILKIVYFCIRALTFLIGIFAVISPLISLSMPTLVYDDLTYIPSTLEILVDASPRFLVGLFILVPNRIFLTRNLFLFRLLSLFAIGGYFLYIGTWGIYEFIYGNKHWMIVPTCIGFGLVGLALPYSIYLKRSLAKKRKGNCA